MNSKPELIICIPSFQPVYGNPNWEGGSIDRKEKR
jgi:hypothetical protein